MPGREQAPHRVVEGSEQVRPAERVGVAELERDADRLERAGDPDVDTGDALEPCAGGVPDGIDVALRLLEGVVNLEQPPVAEGVAGPGAGPDLPDEGGEAGEADDRRLAVRGRPSVHETLRLACLDGEPGLVAQSTGMVGGGAVPGLAR